AAHLCRGRTYTCEFVQKVSDIHVLLHIAPPSPSFAWRTLCEIISSLRRASARMFAPLAKRARMLKARKDKNKKIGSEGIRKVGSPEKTRDLNPCGGFRNQVVVRADSHCCPGTQGCEPAAFLQREIVSLPNATPRSQPRPLPLNASDTSPLVMTCALADFTA